MARPGISYFDVAQAASKVIEGGEHPTIDRVRALLGTGSNSTISAYLKKWKAENMPLGTAVPKTTLPTHLLAIVQSLWDELQNDCKQTIATLESQHAEQSNSLGVRNNSLEVRLNELSEAHEALKIEHSGLCASYEHSQTLLGNLGTECDLLRSKLDHEKTRTLDRDQTISVLNAQIEKLHQSLEHFHQSAQDQRHQNELKHSQSIREQEQRNQALMDRLEQKQKEVETLKLEKEKAGFEVGRLEVEARHRNTLLERESKTLDEAKLTSLRHEECITELRQEVRSLHDKNLTLRESLSASQHQIQLDNAEIIRLQQNLNQHSPQSKETFDSIPE